MFNLLPYKLAPVRKPQSQIVLTQEAKYSNSVSHGKSRGLLGPL